MIPFPFSIRQLQYAVAVADTGGFRRAAERCHVSQPSLSAQLAQLEDALGARLFERDRRRVLLTAAGEELVARARDVLTAAGDLAAAGQRLADPLSGTLRIGVIPTVSPYLLPDVAPVLRRRFPRLTVHWSEDRTAALVRELAEGRLDAALVARNADLAPFEQEPVREDEFVLAGLPGAPLLRSRRRAGLAELAGEPMLLLDEGHCLRDQALAICTSAREVDFRATSLATLARMAAAGAGVTLLPVMSLPVENRRGELSVRRFADPAPGRTIVLAWRRASPLGPALRELAGAMRDDGEPRASQRGEPRASQRKEEPSP